LGFAADGFLGVVVETEGLGVGVDEGVDARGGETVMAAEMAERELAAGAGEPAGDVSEFGIGLLVEGFE
jgi:hypothetical protein